MKIAIIVILSILAYGIIGYVFAACFAAALDDKLEFDFFDESIYLPIALGWILVMPVTIVVLVSKFVGKKLAVIPIAIIALIKAKKEGEQDAE